MNKLFNKFKNLNFKSIARAFSIVWMFLFIVIMTITSIKLDDNFTWMRWLGNSMILFGITGYGLFVADSAARDYGKKRIVRNQEGEIIGGEYQKAIKDYDAMRTSVEPIIAYFDTWYAWYIPQRIENKKWEFLITHEVNSDKAHDIVKYVTPEDFTRLRSEPVKFIDPETKEEVIIRKLQDNELMAVEAVVYNKIPFELSGISYYLSATADSVNKDKMEMGTYYKKARKENRRLGFASRLIIGIVFSLGMSLFTVGDFVSGSNPTAWMNLITRVGNLLTSMLSGWITGASDIHLQVLAIENKILILSIFKSCHEKNMYPHITEKEKAKQEWEENEKRKKEAAENVVTPEVVPKEEVSQLGFSSLQIEDKASNK